MIVECRVRGHSIEATGEIPVACPACGSRSLRAALRVDEPTPEEIDLIMSAIPDAPPDPGDEIEEG
jgi:hypothetical protein